MEEPATADLEDAVISICDRHWNWFTIHPFDECIEITVNTSQLNYSDAWEKTVADLQHEGWLVWEYRGWATLRVFP